MSKLDDLIEKLCPNGVEYKTIEEVCDNVFAGGTPRTSNNEYYGGEIPWLRSGEINFNIIDDAEIKITEKGLNESSAKWIKEHSVLIAMTGATVARSAVNTKRITANQSVCAMEPSKIINYKFLYYCIEKLYNNIKGMAQGALTSINLSIIKSICVPVPPLEIQSEIIHILDNFTLLSAELSAELKARQKQYEYYKEELFSDANNIEYKTLNQISQNCDNKRKPITSSNREAGEYPYYGASGIVDYVKDYIFDGNYLLVSEDGANLVARKTPIAFSVTGKNWVNNHAHVLKFDNMNLQKYVEMYLNFIDLNPYISGAAQPKLNQENLNKIKIPIPEKNELEKIVNILNNFDRICNDLSNGLPAEIKARQKQYEYYRDKLLNFKELKVEN